MTFHWPISVYYEDTDAGGVVYHSNYLNFFERARTEWLKALGVSQTALLADDTAFVVKRAELDFRKAARFEQNLIVETKVIELKKARWYFINAWLIIRVNVIVKAQCWLFVSRFHECVPEQFP